MDRTGERTARDEASRIFEGHKRGLEARRQRDLISEKLLLHIDGSGDWQWADILHGSKIEIPRLVSEYHKTENLLRPIVDNAVAHHTTMPLRYFAESSPDRRAREKAIVDTLWLNYLAQVQDFNGLFAEAMCMAMASGFCPVHAYWREDVTEDWYEPIEYGTEYQKADDPYALRAPSQGMIDVWVGNPFDTVFDRAAKRGSARWSSYARSLPADMVRAAFDHIPEARTLEGTTRVPSASVLQNIARSWQLSGLGVHGNPTMTHRGHGTDDELITLVCRETAPGVLSDWPQGRLQIVAVPGEADTRAGRGTGRHAVLLADQPLPATDFSWSLFYSHHRVDDIHGKPWVEDPDQLQVDLNIAKSKRWEHIQKLMDAPIVAPGGAISEDMSDLDGYNLLEIEPSLAAWRPRVMEWSQSVLPALDREIAELRQAIYTIGGYQAVSRGESPGSRMAYRAIVALQQADQTVHGPVNMRFRRSACDFGRRCWNQMKAYGDVDWLITITGDEFAHLAEPYINNAMLSDDPPRYKLVNAFGPSPELRAEELTSMVQARGADGQPLLRTDEFRRQYPNPLIFDDEGNPKAVQRRRAKTIATRFHTGAEQLRAQFGVADTDPQSPAVQQLATQLFYDMESRYPRLRDDDLQAHVATLSEITQDETSDPIARHAAMKRQDLLYQWQAQMAGQVAPQANMAPAGSPAVQRDPMGRLAIAAEAMRGAGMQAVQVM